LATDWLALLNTESIYHARARLATGIQAAAVAVNLSAVFTSAFEMRVGICAGLVEVVVLAA
jgi:gamma-glutamyl phosphate reductase